MSRTAITGLDKQLAMVALAMDRDITRSAIAVGHVLLNRYNLNEVRADKRCYPSIDMIAAETLYDNRTVKAARKALRKAGYISWTAYGARYNRRCWYEINWRRFEAAKFEHARRAAHFKARRDALAKGDVDTTFKEDAPAGKKTNTENPENSKGDVHPAQRCRALHPLKGDVDTTLNLEAKPISRNREGSANFENEFLTDERGNPSDSEPVGETEIALQKNEGDTSTERPSPQKAQHRWQQEFNNRLRGTDAYAPALEALTPEIQNAATEAEMAESGSGLLKALNLIEANQ